MPIAKETIRMGLVIVAQPGEYVSRSAVDRYGWADKVENGPDVETTGEDSRDAGAGIAGNRQWAEDTEAIGDAPAPAAKKGTGRK